MAKTASRKAKTSRRYVVRSTELVVAAPNAACLDDRDLDRLEKTVTALARTLATARKHGATLLRKDVDDALRPLLAPEPTTRAAAPPPPTLAGDLEMLIDNLAEPSGLTWIPNLVRALGDPDLREAIHAELLRGARAGQYELRPARGTVRLSEDDAAMCIRGPRASKLAWVRRVDGE